MIVDTSVLAAILFDEPERRDLQGQLASSDRLAMSAGSWIELAVVLTRKGRDDLVAISDRVVSTLSIRIAAVDRAQAEIARNAYREFGRGSGHKAKLNSGDCFSYALSKAAGEPLLFKGDDFTHTDVLKVTSRT